jgi:hypothetical protein
MASSQEVLDALLSAIAETTQAVQQSGVNATTKAGALLALAEAYAWAVRPEQSHGGGSRPD